MQSTPQLTRHVEPLRQQLHTGRHSMAVTASMRSGGSSNSSSRVLWVTSLAPSLLCLLLCITQAANTFMVAAAERTLRQTPPPALVILLAQLLQLVLAVGYYVLARQPWAAAGSGGSIARGAPSPAGDSALLLQDTSKQHSSDPGHQPHTTQTAAAGTQLAAAACVCIATNLTFVALRLVSVHTFVLLMAVQVALVPLLTSWSPGGDVPPTKEQLAYLLLPAALLLAGLGACPHRLHGNTLPGILAALAAAACNAAHHVLLMQRPAVTSSGRHAAVGAPSSVLQHLAGVGLNAVLYTCQLALQRQEGAAASSWAALHPLHGFIALGLAAGGFLLPLAVQQLGAGPVTLVQTSALLLAAWLAHMVMWEPVPPLYWVGVACSLCSIALISSSGRKQPWSGSSLSAAGLPTAKPSSNRSSCTTPRPWLWGAQLVALAAVVLCLAPSSNLGRDRYMGGLAPRYSEHQAELGQVYNPLLLQHLPVDRGLRIPQDMLPIDADGMEEVLARVHCRLDEECATTDATCCNFYKARLLDFTARLLAAHGLQQEWFAVYGAVIGAVRDPEGMLPFDRDLDIAMTPRLQRFIESTAVREQAWQYGYYICKESPWKVLPHALHPDPVWQEGFERPVFKWPWRPPPPGVRPPSLPIPTKGKYPHVYLDLWASAALETVADGTYFLKCDPCPDPRHVTSQGLYHLWANTGWVQVTFKRRASIGGVSVAIPDNAEEHLAMVYGPHWRTPDPVHHGKWAQHWNNPRKAPFTGAPDAVTLPPKPRGRGG